MNASTPSPHSYNLIIQGPILSHGRTGATYSHTTNITSDSVVAFNCEQNIKQLITAYGHLFKEIYVVTWLNEEINELNFAEFKNCKIIKLNDPTPKLIIGKKNLPTDFNNKHKQFYSIIKGLELIQERENSFVVKVRTDQYLDLSLLVKEHQETILKEPSIADKLFLPYININAFLAADLYFVARWKTLYNFSDALLSHNFVEFNTSIHLDLSLKYSYLFLKEKINIPASVFFMHSFRKNIRKEKIILRNYLSNHFYAGLSTDIIKTVYWRGVKMQFQEDFFLINAFSNNWDRLTMDPSHYKKTTLKDFAFINFPSYFLMRYPVIKNSFIYFALNFIYKKLLSLKK